MFIALIGAMDRLKQHYKNEAEKFGIDLNVFNVSATGMASAVKKAVAVVLFTSKVSHRARKEMMNAARSRSIPFLPIPRMRRMQPERLFALSA